MVHTSLLTDAGSGVCIKVPNIYFANKFFPEIELANSTEAIHYLLFSSLLTLAMEFLEHFKLWSWTFITRYILLALVNLRSFANSTFKVGIN